MSCASVYEQTHSRQCCNLFISWLWTQPVIVLPSVARACDDQSTVHLDWQPGGYQFCVCVCNVWGINRVLLRISIWFSYWHVNNDFTQRSRPFSVTRYCCADVWSVLAYLCSEYTCTVARPSTDRSGQVRSSTACVWRSFHDARGRSAVRAQPWLLQRLYTVYRTRNRKQLGRKWSEKEKVY